MKLEEIRTSALKLPKGQRARLASDLSSSIPELTKKSNTEEAVALSIINSGCLWWWTWLQFVTSVYFGLPFLDPDPARNLWYYVPAGGWPVNVPSLFFYITCLWVGTLFLSMPIFLSKSRAKIRQIFLMAVFSLISLGFSFYIFKMEEVQYETAMRRLEHYRNTTDPIRIERVRSHVPDLVDVLNTYLGSKE